MAEFPDLMKRAQTGDARAYSELLRQLVPFLRAYVGRRIGGSADVEDVVQEILICLHKARHSYDPSRPFEPWVAAIARYRVLDHQRRARINRIRELDVTFAASGSNMEEMIAQRDLEHAISVLPKGQRTAVQLLKLRQLTLKEAAVISGMTPSALKVAVHRGLKKLRTAFSEPK